MRNQVLALTVVAVVGSGWTVEASALAYRVNAPAYAARLVAQPLAQSEDRAQPERGERRSRAAAKERQICKEIKLVNRGHPGKGDAVYATVTVECPADRSATIDALQAEFCGQTILVKRGYPGQGQEVLESVKVRCPEDQAAPASDKRRTGMETKLCEAQMLVRRGDPGKGEDIFRTVRVDCPADRS